MTKPSHSARWAPLLRRSVWFGILWGLGVTASESLVLPIGAIASLDALQIFLRLCANWVIEGVLIAWFALAVEPWLNRGWKVVLAIAAVALGIGGFDQGLWSVTAPLGWDAPWQSMLGRPMLTLSHFLYIAWMTLFHGGLFIGACVLVARTERSRFVLGQAQIARDRTEAQLDAARLDMLRGQVDPAFLMRAMGVVRDRYVRDAVGADRLLDQLVGSCAWRCPACAATARRSRPRSRWLAAMRRLWP